MYRQGGNPPAYKVFINKMKKELLIIFLLMINVSAYQDALLTIDNKDIGLCLSYDSLNNTKCQNQVLNIEGTKDGTVYIVPETEINSNSNVTSKFEYALFTPFNFIASLLFLFLMFIGLGTAIYVFIAIIKPHI
jgi:hypothetical protein